MSLIKKIALTFVIGQAVYWFMRLVAAPLMSPEDYLTAIKVLAVAAFIVLMVVVFGNERTKEE
jgi:hypothetical protein